MDFDAIKLSREAQHCFAGFFNGARDPGTILPPGSDNLCVGKAECEWDWRKTWGELAAAGLLTFNEVPRKGATGRVIVNVYWQITADGFEYREEDLRRWRAETDRLIAEEEAERGAGKTTT